jgi:hypothetical protein
MFGIFNHQFQVKKLWNSFNLKPSREIGILKEAVKEAILEGEIPNEYDAAYNFVAKKSRKIRIEKNVEKKLFLLTKD